MQYIHALEKTTITETSENRDQKILASKMSVGMNPRGNGNSAEKATDLDSA